MNPSLIILRGSAATEDSETVLQSAGVNIVAHKRIQGFEQLSQLSSGVNEVYVVSAGQAAEEAVAR